MANSIPPLPGIIRQLIAAAPLLLAISALATSFAQYRPGSVDKKLNDSVQQIQQQIHNISQEQINTNAKLSSLQIQLDEDASRRRVIAELEYSSAIIEARTIRQRFGNEVAEKYLANKKKIRDEVIKSHKE